MTKEELKEQDIRLNKLCFDYYEKEKRITELEKENAELKTRNGELAGKVASLERWFGEAKRLLSRWVELFKPKHKSALPIPIQEETEQFLWEVK